MSSNCSVFVDGLKFACRLDGEEGDGPWIVFSNSLATNLSIWDFQIEALARDHRILRYDQRGHGGTDVPEEPCRIPRLAADVLALLDHFEIKRCTFVGLSMGVPTGLQVIVDSPGLIERLILCDGQAETAATGAATWEGRIEEARRDGMVRVADDTVARWFAPEFVAADRAAGVRDMIAATPLEGYISCARALQSYALAPVLAAIKVPTLLIAGSRDGSMPATMQSMSKAIERAQMMEIPNAGHIPNVEQPALFDQAVREFLQATRP